MRPSDKEVRRWAKKKNIPVPERGKVPEVVRDGYVMWKKLEGLKGAKNA